MNIYFACPVISERGDETVYQSIVDTLIADGHQVPTAIIAKPEVVTLEKQANPQEIFTASIRRIEKCDVLIAEVSKPSLGVGYEIAYALNLNKPVLCFYHYEASISKMLTGNTNPQIMVYLYQEIQELIGVMRAFLSRVNPS
ncbi:MAG: nucleoside 2-deoxyribosyltransferase [Anaerolineales bacterium]|nr:nucleoside 2-deoxyribosyltransferase [Anaerolineales bacterium]